MENLEWECCSYILELCHNNMFALSQNGHKSEYRSPSPRDDAHVRKPL